MQSIIRKLITETVTTGGSSVSVTGESVPDSGYMVGGFVDSLILLSEMMDHGNLAEQQITRFVEMHRAQFEQPYVFLGGWLDSETDEYYFDLSIAFEDRESALLAAKQNNELAIWDLEKGEEIRVS